jgi:hypothetical protein
MDVNAKLSTGEEVWGKIICEVSKWDGANESLEAGTGANGAEFERIGGGFVES